MTSSEPLLKTRQVAEALGVSGATVKRWVDAGLIRASRTVGKHRLVPLSEVERMSLELGGDRKPIELAGLSGPSAAGDDDSRVVETLTGLLREGKSAEARRLIRNVSRSRLDAAGLADRLVSPVMERIGHGWMVGAIDVYQEHAASSIVAAGIQERIDEFANKQQSGPAPLALGATTEGDFYVIAGLLAELSLRELGWEVRNLGTNLPLRSLANAARDYTPKLIYLSFGYLKDEDRFVREYQAFHEAVSEVGSAVILGGRALRPELRSRLSYTAFGDRLSHLAEFARQLAPRAKAPTPEPADQRAVGGAISNTESEHHG